MTNIDCQTYQCVFENPWAHLKEQLSSADYSQVFILVDENTRKHCLPILEKEIDTEVKLIQIASGEIHKNIDTCQLIWNELIKNGADRHSCLLNLGGGVIGDMGGFCASTFMRGIHFFQIPTTLLSQVDASVGSKLGIDFNGIKNIIGVFNEPQAVIIYPNFIDTLDKRELRSGYAEIIKHALIKDKELWKQISSYSQLANIPFAAIIHRNVEIKKEVVDQDPLEQGLRKILNFGHTIGHAIETQLLISENRLLHGEAIAIGMICEAWIANHLAMITIDQFVELQSYILNIYDDLPNQIESKKEILQHMKKDKKNKSGIIRASIINDIGSCGFNIPLSEELLIESLVAFEESFLSA